MDTEGKEKALMVYYFKILVGGELLKNSKKPYQYSPLSGKSKSFFKNSGNFVQLLKSVNLQSLDALVSFDVFSLFTNVPVDEDI
jgi:hypothetical protein